MNEADRYGRKCEVIGISKEASEEDIRMADEGAERGKAKGATLLPGIAAPTTPYPENILSIP